MYTKWLENQERFISLLKLICHFNILICYVSVIQDHDCFIRYSILAGC